MSTADSLFCRPDLNTAGSLTTRQATAPLGKRSVRGGWTSDSTHSRSCTELRGGRAISAKAGCPIDPISLRPSHPGSEDSHPTVSRPIRRMSPRLPASFPGAPPRPSSRCNGCRITRRTSAGRGSSTLSAEVTNISKNGLSRTRERESRAPGFGNSEPGAGCPDLLDTTPLLQGSLRNLQNRSHASPTTVARGATRSAVPGSRGFCRKPAPEGQPVVPAVNGCRDPAESARLKQELCFHRYLRSHFVRVTCFGGPCSRAIRRAASG